MIDNSKIMDMGKNPYDEYEQQTSHERHDLRNTIFKEQIVNKIRGGPFRFETVTALETFCLNYMSQNALLSNQTPPQKTGMFKGSGFNQLEYTRLSHEESLLMLFASIHPIDIRRDELYVMLDEVLKHTDLFSFTRMVGNERIGITNGIVTVKNIQEIKQEEVKQEEEKKLKTGGPL